MTRYNCCHLTFNATLSKLFLAQKSALKRSSKSAFILRGELVKRRLVHPNVKSFAVALWIIIYLKQVINIEPAAPAKVGFV